FVTLGDLPWLTPSVYDALLAGDDGSDVVFPVHAGRRGHPVLFHERVKPAVAAADPATGSMRAIAQGLREAEIPWPDNSVLRDVDRPADLA
ncbi:MAG TPA: NTP transferase domain-containing protein, partial [bacterium]|nr:NTP transferase domain-containing protein [bacterium]